MHHSSSQVQSDSLYNQASSTIQQAYEQVQYFKETNPYGKQLYETSQKHWRKIVIGLVISAVVWWQVTGASLVLLVFVYRLWKDRKERDREYWQRGEDDDEQSL